jgi:hypothetical protein
MSDSLVVYGGEGGGGADNDAQVVIPCRALGKVSDSHTADRF